MPIPPKKPSGFSFESATFYFSLLILVAVVASFFYLSSILSKASDELANVTLDAAKTKTEEQKNLKTKLAEAQQKFSDYAKILDSHKSAGNFFAKLETLVLPDIYFLNCNLDLDKLTANFSGRAKTFKSLGQQIMVFESAGEIIGNVDLSKISTNDRGSIDFDVKIGINPAVVVFKK